MRISIALFLIAWSAAGAGADFLLVPDSPSFAPGGRIHVTLYVHNDSTEVGSFDLPARLTLRPRGIPDASALVLDAIEPRQAQARLAPGAFHRARYAGTLPKGMVGEIVLEPVNFEGSPLAFSTSASDSSPLGGSSSIPGYTGCARSGSVRLNRIRS